MKMNSKPLSILLLALLVNCYSLSAQIIEGSIRDQENNEALIGVSIIASPTSKGAITDAFGKFSMDVTGAESLEISYIGYQSLVLPVNDKTNYQITLAPANEVLDEVVVVGYGVIKKSDLTGTVSKIKSEELIKVPSNNAIQALQGKVAGLQILSSSGDPGAAPVVRLRGITTLNNNNPIAVIDGVITDISTVSMLNPNDIESVEVLRDASAVAIYGSRGAAGVILITTKKGSEGENRINASIETAFESIANKIDVLNGREFATYINQINPGTYNNLDVLPDIDWQDLVYRDFAPIINANFSSSGGSQKMNYYFGLGYYDQEGILPKSELQRITSKLNTSYQLSNNIKIGLDLSILLNRKNNAPGVVNTALRAWPIDSPYQEDGVTFAEVNGGNALAAIDVTNSQTNSLRGFGNLYLDYQFLKHFTYKSSVQFDLSNGRTKSFTPQYFVGPLQQSDVSRLSYGFNENIAMIYENTLSYNRAFTKHNINAVAGYTAQDVRGEGLSGTTEQLLREDELFWYLNTGNQEFSQVNNSGFRNTLLSYLGRVNYSYDSRYLATLSFRRDGSSKFGKNNRFGNFPSIALGWNISNEPFFNISSIDRMKIRASWGIIGNERINGDAQYALISSGYNAVLGLDETQYPGASFNGGGNPNLKWEETEQFNIGMDVGFFEERLFAEIDFYSKTTNDILVPLEPIGYSGIGSFRSIFYNAATVRNRGIEWNVNYRNKAGKLNYEFGILGTTIDNTVLDIGQGFGADSLLIGGDLGNGQQVARTSVGNPIGYFYGYDVIGVIQNEQELENDAILFGQTVGDLKYRDVNGDGKITSADRTIIGSSIPRLIYGFNTSLGYGNFNLNLEFQGQYGGDIYNGKQAIRFTTLNYEDQYKNAWTEEGSTNEHFKASQGGTNFLPSSYFIEDGSFLRLRTATINYNVSSRILQRLKMNSANFYIRGTNLFTLTQFTGYSPEIGAGSAIDGVIDRGIYPITRIISVGLNANF